MRRVFNLPDLKKFRQELRRDRSPAEYILWRHLRGRQFLGLKFRRQHSIGRYVADFYCPERHLVIEIDGDGHFELPGLRHDQARNLFFRQLRIETIRFSNIEILENLEGVLARLEAFITTPTPPQLTSRP